MSREIRVYPAACTSAMCGRSSCDGCRNLPALQAFKAWIARTRAVVEDRIWCPLVYTATIPDPEPAKNRRQG